MTADLAGRQVSPEIHPSLPYHSVLAHMHLEILPILLCISYSTCQLSSYHLLFPNPSSVIHPNLLHCNKQTNKQSYIFNFITNARSYGSNKNPGPPDVMASSVVLSMGGSYSPLTLYRDKVETFSYLPISVSRSLFFLSCGSALS